SQADVSAAWQRVCDHFEVLYDTPETLPDLRQTILQLAVQGKLVPQDPNDESAAELHDRIVSLRTQMVDDGVSRKPKTLSETVPPPFPFDLPSNWKWTQLGRLVNVLSSKRIHAREYLKSGVPFYRSKEVGMLSRGCEPHDPHFIATMSVGA
ncbi:MAG: hypothetical protein ABGZ24_12615, partial [Fuerstiella sp.]